MIDSLLQEISFEALSSLSGLPPGTVTAATVVMSAADSEVESSSTEADTSEITSNLSLKEKEILIAAAEKLAKTAKADHPDVSDKKCMEFGLKVLLIATKLYSPESVKKIFIDSLSERHSRRRKVMMTVKKDLARVDDANKVKRGLSVSENPNPQTSVSRKNIRTILNNHDKNASGSESLYYEIIQTYKDESIQDLSPVEVINLKETATYLLDTGEENAVVLASDIIESYFQSIADHPINLEWPESRLEDPITFEEARKIMEERQEYLEETSEEVFGEIDGENIGALQKLYLHRIWEDIQPK